MHAVALVAALLWAHATPDTLTLTLQEALSLAQARNASVQKAWEEVRAATASRHRSVSAFLPTATLTALNTRLVEEERPSPLPPGWEFGLSASWTAWSGGARWADLTRQDATVRMTRASASQLTQEVFRAVVDAYLTLVEAGHALDLAKTSLSLAESTQAQTRLLVQVGKATVGDLLRADASVAQHRTAVVRATSALATAQRALADLLGSPGVIVPVEPRFDPARLVTRVPTEAGTSPSLLLAQARVALAEAGVRSAVADFMPKVTLSLSSSWTEHDRPLQASATRIGVGMTWSLFQGGARVFALQQAKSSRRSARWDLEDARRQMDSDLAQAKADMEASHAQWLSSLQAVEAAQVSLDQQRAMYGLGRATSLDVMSALDTLESARYEEISARYQVLRAYVRLQAALGALGPALFAGSELREEDR